MHRILIAACLSVTLPACELGCRSLSESSHAPEAGLNGGFEVVRDGQLVTLRVPRGPLGVVVEPVTRTPEGDC